MSISFHCSACWIYPIVMLGDLLDSCQPFDETLESNFNRFFINSQKYKDRSCGFGCGQYFLFKYFQKKNLHVLLKMLPKYPVQESATLRMSNLCCNSGQRIS